VGAPAAARLAVAGVQFERIYEGLRAILNDPERPLVAILGGALSLNRLLLVERIAARADTVLVGGELALAFHKAEGLPVGAASVPDVAAEAAARVLRNIKAKLLTPQDYLTADARGAGRDISAPLFEEETDSLRPEHLAVDIGIHTRRSWSECLPPSRTVLWHGPLGICEVAPYSEGTLFLAEEIARRTWRHLHKAVVCGESLTGFLLTRGFPPGKVDCFSPAGTSILHYSAGHPLPAVEALRLSALKPETRSVVLLALSGDTDDIRLAEFAGGWFPETSSIHCIYVEPGPDQDRAPDLYSAITEAEWLEEKWRIQKIFGRTDAAFARFGITPASRSHAHGDPSARLVRRAGELGADVIVLAAGSHPSARYRPNRVVDASPCQVLVLPGTT
jgi:nucleotide-binding universal stress UspA family protein